MDDDLPLNYDVIVIGTGMPECILAAAHARNGRQVLHIDRNEYYGGLWASFSFTGLETWLTETMAQQKEYSETDLNEFLLDDENSILCFNKTDVISNVNVFCALPDADKVSHPDTSDSDQHEGCEEVDKIQVSEANENPSFETKTDIQESSTTWTLPKLNSLYRKFNLDLAPKLLFSRGELVELLISSNIARYAEFKSVTRVLTYRDGRLEQVPCSRADVFSTKNVSIVEKRMLMKLLSYALNYEQHPEEYKGYENKTFVEFLKSRKLTDNILHYMIHAIAMVSQDASTLEGLKATRMFLNSLGRYGNTPFLWPLYGSGELPQCFCRLCAVFGGIYYLKRDVEAIIINSENKCTGIISDGKRLTCKWLVIDANCAPSSFLATNYRTKKISRAIVITDRSILAAEKEQLTFLRLPPENGLQSAVSVIELGPGAMVCPDGLCKYDLWWRLVLKNVVYLTSGTVENAEKDLRPAVDLLFASTDDDNNSEVDKPKILWMVYYNQISSSPDDLQMREHDNVFLTSPPNSCINFDDAVLEAKRLFLQAFPGEEFLPRAPDPEEIVIEDAEEARPEPWIEEPSAQTNETNVEIKEKVTELSTALQESEIKEETSSSTINSASSHDNA